MENTITFIDYIYNTIT